MLLNLSVPIVGVGKNGRRLVDPWGYYMDRKVSFTELS